MDALRRPPRLPRRDIPHRHGDSRRRWSDAFLQYAYAVVDEPAYRGLPATRDEQGKLDWTIPSYRTPGSKNWDGHARRLAWWQTKAAELRVPTDTKSWISRVAKLIHPWGWKPCQPCGRWLRLAYVYPTVKTVSKLNESLPAADQLNPLDFLDIYEVAEHLTHALGHDGALRALALAFPELASCTPSTLDDLHQEIEERVVRLEPRNRLSPGAMSNAPDRLDGFHTYNLCCRSRQDKGRSFANLRTYAVDRRAFEHWSEGDWQAANQLMSCTTTAACSRCGAVSALTADHVGPISLGFQHFPYFEAVCLPCNTAKNNRMSLHDVETLCRLELDGINVVSWHAAALWHAAKGRVSDDAAALRLSKLLKVNQHEFFRLLSRAHAARIPDALLQFLSPHYAETRVQFVGLDRSTLRYERIVRRPRQATYSRSLAARVIRIAFDALAAYSEKRHRNVPVVPQSLLGTHHDRVDRAIRFAQRDASPWREPLLAALDPTRPDSEREYRIQELIGPGFYVPTHDFSYLSAAFEDYMSAVASVLVQRLDDDRAIKSWDTALDGS